MIGDAGNVLRTGSVDASAGVGGGVASGAAGGGVESTSVGCRDVTTETSAVVSSGGADGSEDAGDAVGFADADRIRVGAAGERTRDARSTWARERVSIRIWPRSAGTATGIPEGGKMLRQGSGDALCCLRPMVDHPSICLQCGSLLLLGRDLAPRPLSR